MKIRIGRLETPDSRENRCPRGPTPGAGFLRVWLPLAFGAGALVAPAILSGQEPLTLEEASLMFQDGKERSFVNDLDSAHCCYYAGVRLL